MGQFILIDGRIETAIGLAGRCRLTGTIRQHQPPTGTHNSRQSGHGGRKRLRRQMHQDGTTEHIRIALIGNRREVRQRIVAQIKLGIRSACCGNHTDRAIIANRRKACRHKPGRIAATAATNINGRLPGHKRRQHLQLQRTWRFAPLGLRETLGLGVIDRKCRWIQTSPLYLFNLSFRQQLPPLDKQTDLGETKPDQEQHQPELDNGKPEGRTDLDSRDLVA